MSAKTKKNTMSASDAKNNFGELLECARKNPVRIERNGRPVAVVVSVEQCLSVWRRWRTLGGLTLLKCDSKQGGLKTHH